jgi:hypothetical protein
MPLNLTPIDAREWVTLSGGFADRNYRQTWGFGVACAARVGAVSEHVAIRNDSQVIALADVRIKSIPLIGGGIAYVNGGPLVRRSDGSGRGALAASLEILGEEYVRRRGFVLRIAPALGPPEWNEVQSRTCEDAGLKPVAGGGRYRTILVDLRPPLDAIRRSLAQKWRNCLNRAEKNGLTLRRGTDAALFDEFGRLFAALRGRKEFAVELDAAFYARVQAAQDPAEKFHVTLAEFEGRPVAGHVGSMLGESCVYLLGASNEEGLAQKASYLVQWDVIRSARDRGCQWYDLGGIDPENNPGVYHFKEGLGGMDITSPGPFESAPRGLKQLIALGGERLYRTLTRRTAASMTVRESIRAADNGGAPRP